MPKEEPKIKYEKREPLNFEAKEDFATFSVKEREDATLEAKIITKDGKELNFESLLPDGVRMLGLRAVLSDDKYFGLGDGGSYYDHPTRRIIFGEKDMTKFGWRSFFVLLHEIGHAVTHNTTSFPKDADKLYGDMRSVEHGSDEYKKLEIEEDELFTQDERNAWAYALKQMRKLVEELELPQYAGFSDRKTLKNFIRDNAYFE